MDRLVVKGAAAKPATSPTATDYWGAARDPFFTDPHRSSDDRTARAVEHAMRDLTTHIEVLCRYFGENLHRTTQVIETVETTQALMADLVKIHVTDTRIAQGKAEELERRNDDLESRNAELEAQLDALRG